MATRESNTEKNKAKVKKVLDLIAKGFNIADACAKIKISKPTFYHWKRYVVSLEEEKLNFVDLYAKRLKNELETHMGVILKLSDCTLVVEKMFNKRGTENEYGYAEKPNYIELTAHSFKD